MKTPNLTFLHCGLAVLLSAAVYACGDAAETMGGVMRDAGDILVDAGRTMSPDASAQTAPRPSEIFTVVFDEDAAPNGTALCRGDDDAIIVRGPVVVTHVSYGTGVSVVRADGTGPCEELAYPGSDTLRVLSGAEIYIDADHVLVGSDDGVVTGRRL